LGSFPVSQSKEAPVNSYTVTTEAISQLIKMLHYRAPTQLSDALRTYTLITCIAHSLRNMQA